MLSLKRIDSLTWSTTILNLVGKIREYKGKEALFEQQTPEVLETLKKIATVQSVESSNRIEGITIPEKRLALLFEGVRPQDRSEADIAGYRDVLSLIHTSAQHVPLKTGVILQLHKEMMQYATDSGGRWKSADNKIIEKHPTGEERVRFIPVPAWQTNEAMEELVDKLLSKRDQGMIDELILIGAFILDFLCIHPFSDGNGRMARLLTLLLLYQAGFEVGRYVSIEKVVEETKEQYYDTLEKSSISWHEGTNDLQPWLEYFLTMLLKCYKRFEERIGVIVSGQRGWKESQIKAVVDKMVANFTIQEVLDNCPGISRPTIQRVLNQLSHEKVIECIGRGRKAEWRKL